LRLKIVKNRTQGINKWHKVNKEFFLTGGKFVDAIKRKEIQVNESMEEKLMTAEKHFENLEKERIAAIQKERVTLISEYLPDANERDLASMEVDLWDLFFDSKKKAFFEEKERIEKERQAVIEKEKAEAEERERIRKENEELKAAAAAKEKELQKEREEREAILKEEREKVEAERQQREKEKAEEQKKLLQLQAELKAKKEAEAERIAEAKAKEEAELSKGDQDKIKELISDLDSLKTKYSFKSNENQKKYKDVQLLLDKIIGHIKQ